MASNDGATGYKLLGTVGAAAAAFAAKKILSILWTKVTGKEPPDKPESLDVEAAEAIAWAVVSGVVIGVARLLAQRKVAQTWLKANGEVPDGSAVTSDPAPAAAG